VLSSPVGALVVEAVVEVELEAVDEDPIPAIEAEEPVHLGFIAPPQNAVRLTRQ
jgi:hypothetical protein